MKYDYIIKNGTMFDFVNGGTYCGDIYVRDGRIVDAASDVDISYEGIVDARGKYVVPGLIDEHAHWAWGVGSLGINADQVCPNCGVTTTVDAGSTGVENFEDFYRSDVLRYKTRVMAYLHISSTGVLVTASHDEDQDPAAINEAKILRLFEQYPDCLKGLKVRISKGTMKYGHGLEPLAAAVRLADKINSAGHACCVAVHVAELSADTSIETILDMLRPGDVYTHLYQNLGPTIFNPDGTVLDCMKAARARGVLFSSGNGGKHWCFENLEKAYADGFYPDFISSDIVDYNCYLRPGFNLLYAMNTSLIAGMKPEDIFRAVTVNPAKHLSLCGPQGMLAPGADADLAIFDLMDAKVEFIDRFKGRRISEQLLVPLMTFRKGRVQFRQIFFGNGQDFSKTMQNYVGG